MTTRRPNVLFVVLDSVRRDHSDSTMTQEDPTVHRDSAADARSWKDRLTASEIVRVREQVIDVSTYFYSMEDRAA